MVSEGYYDQLDLFGNVIFREKCKKVDAAVDDIRRRFGYLSIQRGLMYKDLALSSLDVKCEHKVHYPYHYS